VIKFDPLTLLGCALFLIFVGVGAWRLSEPDPERPVALPYCMRTDVVTDEDDEIVGITHWFEPCRKHEQRPA
jgi:hypothetical protein